MRLFITLIDIVVAKSLAGMVAEGTILMMVVSCTRLRAVVVGLDFETLVGGSTFGMIEAGFSTFENSSGWFYYK